MTGGQSEDVTEPTDTPSSVDLWGIGGKEDALREKAWSEIFAGWWEETLDRLDTLVETSAEANLEAMDGEISAVSLTRPAQGLAFGYALTQREDFGRRAIELLNAAVDCGNVPEGGHANLYQQDPADLTTARCAKAYMSVADWVWALLPQNERAKLVLRIADCWGRPIYDGMQKGCWWANALNSNWTAMLNSGLGFAALMLRKVDAETSEKWLAPVRNTMVDMLDVAAEEGAGVEGPSYWLGCFRPLQDFVEALINVTGEDLYTHPFWERCSRFLPYLTLPDMSAWANIDDTRYKGLAGSAFFHAVATRKGDALAQWYGNEILRRHNDASWKNIVHYDPDMPEGDITNEPTCRFFSSIHLSSFRSNWEEDGVFLLFKGGSNAWSHTHLDLNSFFLVAYGERLATEPGPKPYSIDYWHSIEPPVSTSWHNCIVVDGAHQRVPAQYAMSYDLQEAGDCYSRFSDYVSSAQIAMISGDASTAYGDTMERAVRHVIYLKPDTFVIYDDLLTHPVRTQRNIEWLLHSECAMSDVESGIRARGDNASLLIQPILPVDWERKYVEGKTVPKADDKPLHCVSIRQYWHHKWNIDPQRSAYPHWDPRGNATPLYTRDYQFLIVLQACRDGNEPGFKAESIDEGNVRGVALRADNERALVLFNRNGDMVDLNGVKTDAEKAVVRTDGKNVNWAIIRGTQLKWEGRCLFEGAARTSQVGGDR